ncbi:MAG: ribonuclease H family protein [Planctomycetota bacterium]|jgi:ribonuclease HII
MLVYAGIDEAGYGPMLGPLCIGAVAFVLPGDDPADGPPNLWRRLSAAVCRGRRDRRRRIAVDDSKRLKGAAGGRAHPLTHLERAVLCFAAAAGDEGLPLLDASVFRRLGAAVPAADWYGSRTPLPVGQTRDELRIATARLRRALETQGVEGPVIRCEAIHADDFNRQVEAMGNKANVNFCRAMRLADAVWRRWGADHPRLVVDRHGGRTQYRDELRQVFPEATIRVVAETAAVSRYRLAREDTALTISFEKEAESAHLPVALASMTAKYVRELLMLRLNRFFTTHLPRLRPTAGYVTDARRFLRDVEPVITRLGIERRELVRSV